MNIIGVPVSPEAQRVLEEILTTAQCAGARVTSVARTPAAQARVMYENLQLPVPAERAKVYPDAVAWQKGLYKSPGRAVIDEYVAAKAEGLDRDAIIARMCVKIEQLGPSLVSRHCAGPDAPCWVIDIGPSSIPVEKRGAFVSAARKHPRVVQFFEPPQDPAYHLEIHKS